MSGKYSVGDVWGYHTREGEEGSTIVINKIDHNDDSLTYHISIMDIKLETPKGIQTSQPHIPVSIDTLNNSVTEKLGIPAPDTGYEAGYKYWQDAKGGVFSVTIKEILGFVEQAFKK